MYKGPRFTIYIIDTHRDLGWSPRMYVFLSLRWYAVLYLSSYDLDWPYCNAAQNLRSVIRASDDSWDELAYRRKLETFNGLDDGAALAKGNTHHAERWPICLHPQ